ncbi:hypothetical protein DERP_010809 [Dermatophagoides pteronyssinus]|uniref:Uncharacterized protein n=1 Tax=Dermatophagoides pteronyssinus TaxID=6956 RepID=A0ABQ8J7C6_DERPT|nr:hypothetical protein DERP_010809 [Dermatophagoides pteronyssinus]
MLPLMDNIKAATTAANIQLAVAANQFIQNAALGKLFDLNFSKSFKNSKFPVFVWVDELNEN